MGCKHKFIRTTKDYKSAYKCYLCKKVIAVDEYKNIKNNKHNLHLEYENGMKAGQVSKKYNVCVGELGCKSCGTTIVGAFMENECGFCGEKLI